MFRRKEDSLFDSATDPNQDESVEAVSSPSASSPSSSSSMSSGSTPAYLSGAASASPAARAPESRPSPASSSAVPTASSFRPTPSAASPASDLTRNRMPEPSKSSAAASPAPAPSASSFGMSMSKQQQGKRVLTVGNDILLKGEIATCDRLVIEGKVDATLNDVHTVEIAETGSFKGAAHIEDAEISGLFEGDLVVRNRLVIYATGKVRGNITYGEIEIERGGELTGEIKSSNPGSQTASARPARQKEREAA